MDERSRPDRRSRHYDTTRPVVRRIALSQTGLYIALLTPLQLLLTLHLTRISGGAAATAAFSVVTGVGAIAALLFTPIAGRISDRTTARFGRRRTWILTGAIAGGLVLVLLGQATAVWQVVALWCVAKAVLSFQHAATTATVADQVPSHRRGLVSGVLGFGLSVSPLLGIAFVNTFTAGSAAQWYAVAGAVVLGGVPAWLARCPLFAGCGVSTAELCPQQNCVHSRTVSTAELWARTRTLQAMHR